MGCGQEAVLPISPLGRLPGAEGASRLKWEEGEGPGNAPGRAVVERGQRGQHGALGTGPSVLSRSVSVPSLLPALPRQGRCLKSRGPSRPLQLLSAHTALGCASRALPPHPPPAAAVFTTGRPDARLGRGVPAVPEQQQGLRGPHLVVGQVQVIEAGQVLKRLLGEPFKGQASVRALDEGDATGEHTSATPQAHPACQAWGGRSRRLAPARPSRSPQPPAHSGLRSEEQVGQRPLRGEPPGWEWVPPVRSGQGMGDPD